MCACKRGVTKNANNRWSDNDRATRRETLGVHIVPLADAYTVGICCSTYKRRATEEVHERLDFRCPRICLHCDKMARGKSKHMPRYSEWQVGNWTLKCSVIILNRWSQR